MPANKKPRKAYRPKARFVNPIDYVLEGFKSVAQHDSYLVDLKIRNSLAMTALLRGTATKKDMDTLIAMSNIAEALQQLGFGSEYVEVCTEGRYAILSIVFRAIERLRFVPTGPEIQMLNRLMELHDAQMDVITIADMERALILAKKQIRSRDAIELPKVPKELA